MRIRTENIFQVIEVEASPMEVYNALIKDKQLSKITGLRAKIDSRVGGRFDTCNERNWGYILELIEGKRIIMAWSHVDFADEFFTIVDIELEKIDSGTRIKFNHLGIPEDSDGWLTEGWQKVYWNRLKSHFSKNKKAKAN